MNEHNCTAKVVEGAIAPKDRVADFNKPLRAKYGTLYKTTGNLLIICDCFKGVPKQFVGCTRDKVSAFSDGSRGRMRRYLRECVSDYRYMHTLTYPGFYPSNGAQVKEHLRQYCQQLKRYRARIGGDSERFSAFWFLEFQSRGAPHFHLFTTDEFPLKWVASTWYFIVKSEDSRHLQAGTRVESIRSGKKGIMSYAAKYAEKQDQKLVPDEYLNVGRFWGVYGRRTTVSAATWVDSRHELPGSVSGPLFLLMKQINALVFDGQMELYKRIEGSAVFNIMTEDARRRIFARVSHLAVMTMTMDCMFDDADIDQGESLSSLLMDLVDTVSGSRGFTMSDLMEIAQENRRNHAAKNV